MGGFKKKDYKDRHTLYEYNGERVSFSERLHFKLIEKNAWPDIVGVIV